MRILKLAIALSFTIVIFFLKLPSIQAVKLPDGRVAFEKSPRLTNVITTFNSTSVWGAKYYFTLELPENAGEPLSKVIIQQREGVEAIRFQLEKTLAFEGNHTDKGENLTVKNVTQDEETGEISVIFDQEISPGTTFTVGLKPVKNPDYSGVYLFGVTAFPQGEKPEGLYLGVGRLHFYRSSDYN